MIEMKQDQQATDDQDASQSRLAILACRKQPMAPAHRRLAGQQPQRDQGNGASDTKGQHGERNQAQAPALSGKNGSGAQRGPHAWTPDRAEQYANTELAPQSARRRGSKFSFGPVAERCGCECELDLQARQRESKPGGDQQHSARHFEKLTIESDRIADRRHK